jgi:chitinase
MAGTLATTRPAPAGARTALIARALWLLLGSGTAATAAAAPGVVPEALPALSIADLAVNEGNVGTTAFMFTVTLSTLSASPVTVQYQTQDGTATLADQDYLAASGTLVIPSGAPSGTLTVTVLGDSANELWDTFQVVLSSPTNATILDGTAIGTIRNDDTVPNVYVDDAGGLEGNFGIRTFQFRLRLSRANKVEAATVDFATQDGSASSAPGQDYQAATGTASFPPGTRERFVTVSVRGDLFDEADEDFSLRITRPRGCVIADNTAAGTIRDDDPGTPLDVDVLYPDGGETLYAGDPAELRWTATSQGFPITSVDLQVSRDGGQTFDPIVFGAPNTGLYRWDPVTGPTGPSGTVGFTAILKVIAHDEQSGVGEGWSAQPFAIADDPTRIVTTTSLAAVATSACGTVVTLTATEAPAGVTGTVEFLDGNTSLGEAPLDGSGQATLLVSSLALGSHTLRARFDGSATHRASASAPVVHEVQRLATQTQIVLDSEVALCHAPLLLTGIVDPAPSTGTVQFFEGSQPLTPPVPVGPGGFAYGSAALQAPGSHAIRAVYSGGGCWDGGASPEETVEIQPFASTPIQIAVSQNPVTAGDSVSLGVTLPAEATGAVEFFDGPASLGVAPAAGGGAALFLSFTPPGGHPLVARYSGDPCHPPATSDTLVLGVTPVPEVAIADAGGPEDGADLVFMVTLSLASTQTVRIAYLTRDGTATAPSDYGARTGTLTFPPGETARTLTVRPSFDYIVEPDETFEVVLRSPVFVTVQDSIGLGAIANDDTVPQYPAYVNDSNAWEGLVTGGIAQFTITGTNASGVPASVSYRTVDGTAIAGIDYVAAAGTATIAPNENQPYFLLNVQVLPDTLDEPDEYFTIELFDPVNTTIERAVGQARIWDDDPPAIVYIDDAVPVWEGGAGQTLIRFLLHFERSPGFATMTIRTRDGSATTASGDYLPYFVGWGFGGVSAYSIDVLVQGDALYESDETLFLDLVDISNTVIVGRASAQGVIRNDDAPLAADPGAPLAFALRHVVPNPSRGAIRVEYTLPAEAPVRVSVHDVQGREVAELVEGVRTAGRHTAAWNGRSGGAPVAAGIYFVRCRSDDRTAIARFVVAR